MDTYPPPTPSGEMPVQPPQKSNTTKIIIIVAAVLAGLCLVSCVVIFLLFRGIGQRVSQSVDSNPQDVASAGAQIATFSAPAEFEPQSSFSLLGMTFVIYEAKAEEQFLMIFQMPTSMEMTDANIRQMEEQMQRQTGRQLENYRTIDEYDATIRGQPGKVIIQEGESNGKPFRQMIAVFEGKGGLAMLTIIGPADNWNQDAYDQMIQSMQ